MTFQLQSNSRRVLYLIPVLALLFVAMAQPVPALEPEGDPATALSQMSQKDKARFAPTSEDLQKAKDSGDLLSLPQAIRDSIEMTDKSYKAMKKGTAYVAEGFRIAPQEISKALDKLTLGQGTGRLLYMIGVVLFIYGAGLCVEWAARLLTRRLRHKVEEAPTGNLFKRLINDLILTGFEVGYFLIFLYSTINIIVLLAPAGKNIELLAGGFLIPITRARIGILIIKFLFSPHSSESRFVPITDYAAKELTFWLSLTMILSPLFARVIYSLSMMGLADETFEALFMLEIIIPTSLLLALIWKNKNHLKNYILQNYHGQEQGAAGYWLANNWHRLASAYLLFLVFLRQTSLLQGKDMVGALLISLVSVPGIILLDMTLFAALKNMAGKKKSKDQDEKETTNSFIYISHVHSALRTILALGLGFYLLGVWGLSFNIGPAFSKGALSIFVTVLVSYLIWEYLSGLIDAQFDGQDDDGEEMEEMGKGGSRKNTLLTLLKKFLLISIVIMSALIILTSVGVNIAPLLAGAGIFGLAVGFGSQTLVKDVLSGVFFLVDDAFRIGDYVEAGRLKGTVERISVRSISLRHSRGQLQIIPYGSLGSVTNFSRDWTAMKLEVRIPFDVDPEKVRKIIKKMGKKIAEDEELGPLLLSPIKSQGVKEIDDSSQVTRIKFRCRPGDQFSLRKEVFRRVREAFAANGIEFAPRKVTVHVPNLENAVLTKEQLTTIAAAAAETGLAASDESKNKE